ncbi:putative WD repeat-containing protein [Lachnellula hyalina]|uniref:Putative WD repeat-containing protein n=1 Tax=Lachnellula hyalina TaxID=1316788 RepID=A0A8H8R8X7_9HELO|nr:putative WD repeat-containing protein [Lachnellula hyalina]TVY29856.1 putative WD repeat-containing protein [Lachnellula hyalina]
MSSEVALPKIRVIDTHNLAGSATGTNGTSGLESPSNTTDGGTAGRPRSATSSEESMPGLLNMCKCCYCASLIVVALTLTCLAATLGNAQPNTKKSPIKLVRNTGSSKDINGGKSSAAAGRAPTAIDPLSHHILKRTNTENTIPPKLRNAAAIDSTNVEVGTPSSPEIGTPGRQNTPEIIRSDSNPVKEKKKGVSFLSRFSIIGGKKKDQSFDGDDDESEPGDARTEGMNAHVFSSSIGANGYMPQHKEPPRYIKVRAHNKKSREFDRMFLAQELSGTKHDSSDDKVPGLTTTTEVHSGGGKLSKAHKSSGAIWATEFSKDGKYLAAAGRDQVVRVWAVISTPDERHAHEGEEDMSSSASGVERLSTPVFRSKPIQEFGGHTGDILDLSWSKNNFLLSSSMDKTVRLWHISRKECLCTFKHKDFVTSIAFHPTDDRFFLAGSLDSVLRLWSIPDKTVAFWNQLPDLITAVAFTPDGKTAMAGVLSGLCLFYETEGLKYQAQIHVRSSRGKNAKGSKITGIRTATRPGDPEGDIKVLITSNDSRVRMYNLKDKSLEMKFRGHENICSQINASFSDDFQYVICGSEDRKAYIWNTAAIEGENKDKRPVEYFEAHADMVTTAVIAPIRTRQLLSASGDPIYDLCNPPPIRLLSREESNASSMPRQDSEKRLSDAVSEPPSKKPEESPAYLARCTHLDGNIIITADYLGRIKVFRQDCAYQKRRNDHWETSSAFSKKVLGRSSSIMTKASVGSHSRRNSTSQNSLAGLPSDHILSWRNTVLDSSPRSAAKTIESDRSVSPGKFNRSSQSTSNSQNNLASAARQQPYAGTPLTQTTSSVATTSPPQSLYKATTNNQPPTPSFSFQGADDNGLKLDASGKSYQFWNPASWKNPNQSGSKLDADGLRPPNNRGNSEVSKLSSDETTSGELDDESDSEALSCKKCGGRDFRARKVVGKGQRLVCTKCGMTAD